MIELDIDRVDTELRTISGGKLNCLPYARTLLDYFELLGVAALPLVARAVVFGTLTGCSWDELFQKVSPIQLFQSAVASPHANGSLQFSLPFEEGAPPKECELRYRTLGYTHQQAKEGSFASDGTWNGHIVVVINHVLIDMTIGQLNDPRFGIMFEPPHITAEVDDDFLSGTRLLSGMQGGMLLCYQAFPNERSFEQSGSWKDQCFRMQLHALAKLAAAKASKPIAG